MEYVTVGEFAVRDSAEQIAKAIANGRRLEVLEVLTQGERSVDSLARDVSSSVSTVSAQLQVLRRAGLVRTRRAGTTIFYRVADSEVARLLVVLNSLARNRVAEQIAASVAAAPRPASPGAVPIIDAASVTSEMLVVDVRSRFEYDAAHFPGAISIPWDELPERWSELPEDQYVVVYCRSGWCETAQEGAQYLREQGLEAASMGEGIVEWIAEQAVDLDAAR